MNVLEIKELEGYWQVKVSFSLSWYDKRLEYQNLKDNIDLNILADEERELIWFPEVLFVNNDEAQRMVLDRNTDIKVERLADGEPSSFLERISSEIFEGVANPIQYERTYSLKFECDFQLQSYPFDTQECTMELAPLAADMDIIDLVPEAIKYQGADDLPQFRITKESFTTTTTGKTTVTKFIITMSRKIAYHITSVYLPSSTIFVISLITLFVSIEHFEATIMVHLTAMLVMYTLLQAVSVSLPKVS